MSTSKESPGQLLEHDQSIDVVSELRGLTGENCRPSENGVAAFQAADIVLFTGQFVGAGKSTVANALVDRRNIASWTNRDLRPGEVEGVDKCHKTLEEMLEAARSGLLLEMEEVRPGTFYATPAELGAGKHVKDLELVGAQRLRSYVPGIKMVVPLPPLDIVDKQGLTSWEQRLVMREGYDRAIDNKMSDDLAARLQGVIDECQRILDDPKLMNNPNILFVVNDDLSDTVKAVQAFIDSEDEAPRVMTAEAVQVHVLALRELASEALAAA